MLSWTALIATLIAGPLAFLVLSTILSRRRETVRFPVGIVDAIGDCVALPIFNGFAFGLGLALDVWRLAFALLASALATIVFYRMSVRTAPNWSKHDDSSFNAGGWYHLAFYFVQAGLVAYALLAHPSSLALWISILAYGATSAYYLFVQFPYRARRARGVRSQRSEEFPDNET